MWVRSRVDAALAREGFCGGRRRRARRLVFADHLLVQAIEQRVQFGERIAGVCRAQVERKVANRRIRLRQRCIAQEQARRKSLERAAHDSVGILRFDLAVDLDAQLRKRAVGGEDVGEVAEGILVGIEPRVAGDVDPPVDHILALVVARGQPQHLDDARGRRFVAMDDAVGDTKAHVQESAISSRSVRSLTAGMREE